jgi:hypothetical protein
MGSLIQIDDPTIGRMLRVHVECQKPVYLFVRPGVAKRHAVGIRLTAGNSEIYDSHRGTSLWPERGHVN